jgi:hypothetical protein
MLSRQSRSAAIAFAAAGALAATSFNALA